jgi:hypothetical protein
LARILLFTDSVAKLLRVRGKRESGRNKKGEAAMRTFARQISMIALLATLLAPGLLQARTAPVRHDTRVPRASVSGTLSGAGAFSAVWNLLSSFLKTGPGLDPAGSPPPPSGNSATSGGTGDTGPQLDPAGVPK